MEIIGETIGMNKQEIADLVKGINKFYEMKNKKNNFYRNSLFIFNLLFISFLLGMYFADALQDFFDFEYYIMFLIYGIIEFIIIIPFCLFYFTTRETKQVYIDEITLSLQAFPDSEDTKELLSKYYLDKNSTNKESFKTINILCFVFLIFLALMIISFIFKIEVLCYIITALMIGLSFLINFIFLIKHC